ncbi:hypothetical protein [Halovivax gelatinilyticus]|uniref:hypothetical protein n=1 Tax=Halovivax gelatinilyticus TaxID=2961597 RepID=UPI0020CA4F96|nr:hypothetical protein [Halovivax gelatinilyticus]
MIVEFAFFVGSVRYVRHLRYNRRNTIEYGNVYNHYEQRIRVEEDTYAALKGDDGTFDDLLTRLVDERCEQIRAGAGLWQGTHAAEKARDVRSQLKRDVGSR